MTPRPTPVARRKKATFEPERASRPDKASSGPGRAARTDRATPESETSRPSRATAERSPDSRPDRTAGATPAAAKGSTGTRAGRTAGTGRRRPARPRPSSGARENGTVSGVAPAKPARRSSSTASAAKPDRRVVEAPKRFRPRILTWRRVVAALVVVALASAAVWALYFSTLLTVRRISVEGTGRQDPAAVKALLDPDLGRPLARVNLADAAARVATLAAVKDVQVTRAWPNGLDVRVVERTPVAVVSLGSDYTLIDAEGVKMATTPKVPADLPVMTKATVNAGPGATLAVSQSLDRLSPELLAKVRSVSARTQDSVVFTLKSGATVKWGSSENSEQKSEVLGVLLAHVKAHIYDVRAPDLPVTKK